MERSSHRITPGGIRPSRKKPAAAGDHLRRSKMQTNYDGRDRVRDLDADNEWHEQYGRSRHRRHSIKPQPHPVSRPLQSEHDLCMTRTESQYFGGGDDASSHHSYQRQESLANPSRGSGSNHFLMNRHPQSTRNDAISEDNNEFVHEGDEGSDGKLEHGHLSRRSSGSYPVRNESDFGGEVAFEANSKNHRSRMYDRHVPPQRSLRKDAHFHSATGEHNLKRKASVKHYSNYENLAKYARDENVRLEAGKIFTNSVTPTPDNSSDISRESDGEASNDIDNHDHETVKKQARSAKPDPPPGKPLRHDRREKEDNTTTMRETGTWDQRRQVKPASNHQPAFVAPVRRHNYRNDTVEGYPMDGNCASDNGNEPGQSSRRLSQYTRISQNNGKRRRSPSPQFKHHVAALQYRGIQSHIRKKEKVSRGSLSQGYLESGFTTKLSKSNTVRDTKAPRSIPKKERGPFVEDSSADDDKYPTISRHRGHEPAQPAKGSSRYRSPPASNNQTGFHDSSGDEDFAPATKQFRAYPHDTSGAATSKALREQARARKAFKTNGGPVAQSQVYQSVQDREPSHLISDTLLDGYRSSNRPETHQERHQNLQPSQKSAPDYRQTLSRTDEIGQQDVDMEMFEEEDSLPPSHIPVKPRKATKLQRTTAIEVRARENSAAISSTPRRDVETHRPQCSSDDSLSGTHVSPHLSSILDGTANIALEQTIPNSKTLVESDPQIQELDSEAIGDTPSEQDPLTDQPNTEKPKVVKGLALKASVLKGLLQRKAKTLAKKNPKDPSKPNDPSEPEPEVLIEKTLEATADHSRSGDHQPKASVPHSHLSRIAKRSDVSEVEDADEEADEYATDRVKATVSMTTGNAKKNEFFTPNNLPHGTRTATKPLKSARFSGGDELCIKKTLAKVPPAMSKTQKQQTTAANKDEPANKKGPVQKPDKLEKAVPQKYTDDSTPKDRKATAQLKSSNASDERTAKSTATQQLRNGNIPHEDQIVEDVPKSDDDTVEIGKDTAEPKPSKRSDKLKAKPTATPQQTLLDAPRGEYQIMEDAPTTAPVLPKVFDTHSSVQEPAKKSLSKNHKVDAEAGAEDPSTDAPSESPADIDLKHVEQSDSATKLPGSASKESFPASSEQPVPTVPDDEERLELLREQELQEMLIKAEAEEREAKAREERIAQSKERQRLMEARLKAKQERLDAEQQRRRKKEAKDGSDRQAALKKKAEEEAKQKAEKEKNAEGDLKKKADHELKQKANDELKRKADGELKVNTHNELKRPENSRTDTSQRHVGHFGTAGIYRKRPEPDPLRRNAMSEQARKIQRQNTLRRSNQNIDAPHTKAGKPAVVASGFPNAAENATSKANQLVDAATANNVLKQPSLMNGQGQKSESGATPSATPRPGRYQLHQLMAMRGAPPNLPTTTTQPGPNGVDMINQQAELIRPLSHGSSSANEAEAGPGIHHMTNEQKQELLQNGKAICLCVATRIQAERETKAGNTEKASPMATAALPPAQFIQGLASLAEEDRWIIEWRDNDGMQWKELTELWNKKTGKNLSLPGLQSRYHKHKRAIGVKANSSQVPFGDSSKSTEAESPVKGTENSTNPKDTPKTQGSEQPLEDYGCDSDSLECAATRANRSPANASTALTIPTEPEAAVSSLVAQKPALSTVSSPGKDSKRPPPPPPPPSPITTALSLQRPPNPQTPQTPQTRPTTGGKSITFASIEAFYASLSDPEESDATAESESEDDEDQDQRGSSPITAADSYFWEYHVKRKSWDHDHVEKDALWMVCNDQPYYSMDEANLAAGEEIMK
ncbi:hypothetical protein K432DRAFT_429333, partial [Lepidopterella palustris CBS 459.81]